MIVEAIGNAIYALLITIFGWLPSLPPIPDAISSGGSFLVDLVDSGMGMLRYIYSPALVVAIFSLFIVLVAFDQIYWLVLWILRKIPMLSIK